MKTIHTPTRILVADDDCTMNLIMQAALQAYGYEVTVVEDGVAALAAFHAHPADIVLLDVEMPGLTGYEVCKKIRLMDSDVPVVLITGHDDEASIDRAYETGATDFIVKPVNWTLIRHRLRYILRAFRDAAQRREAETKVRRLAYFDALTGLPNRQSFAEHLTRELSRKKGKTTSVQRLAVLFLDLDSFKNINDSLGHGIGDLVLQWTSDRLRSGLHSSNTFSRPSYQTKEDVQPIPLARMGGDEFTILLPSIEETEDALVAAHRVRELIGRPFVVEGQALFVTASIGVAIYPDDASDADTLLMHAETAMYAAKDNGKNTCQYYSASLTKRAVARLAMESALRLALERDEFFLVYQPQIDVVHGTIQSVEALIRWQHPEKGLISPLDFIPLAEELGLILPIGAWVLKTACTDAMRWCALGLNPIRMAVNLSAIQFRNHHLQDDILAILAQTGMPASQLELEITESILMEDATSALSLMHSLRDHGMHIALDDFGTGYSSLQYIKQLPLSKLKIDRAFVRDLPASKADEAIIRAVVAMAKTLGIRVIAEGVETSEQYLALAHMGCDSIQGYFFSEPLSFEKMADFLTNPLVE
jgi:diguanylate cyclase (GGDEF)-like protein